MSNKGEETGRNYSRHIRAALAQLDREMVLVDGKMMLPSQCYHIDMDPPHVLFNTNCPETLKEKIQAILSRYTELDEGRTQ